MLHDDARDGSFGQETQTMHSNAPQNESPLEILKRRYALGEITHEQFEEMKRVLGIANVAPTAEHAPH